MSWMKGTGPIIDVGAYGVSKGLPEQWGRDGYSVEEFKKGNFWDVIDNPLYEAAAGALGYDWDKFVEESKGKVGADPNDGTVRVRARVKAGTSGVTRVTKKGGGFKYKNRVGAPAEYEWMTRDEADAQGFDYQKVKTTRWRNKKTGKVTTEGNPFQGRGDSTIGGANIFVHVQMKKLRKKWDKEHEEIRDWGISDLDLAEDLDKISSYLTDIVNINDHLHPIIREGPKGEHYGITGDIWEHYGLDKEPEPPKELDWDSYDKKMNLATTVKSHVTYSTPEGITPVDLHSDG